MLRFLENTAGRLLPRNSGRITPMAKLVTRDPDIRSVLMRELEQLFSNPDHDLILQEFSCNTSRIDVAIVNGSLHGFEIKSDSDSLVRLVGQVEEYGRVFDFVTLVCGRKLFSAARELVPKWWGLRIARFENGRVTLSEIRRPKQNTSQDKAALARMLWKDEALRCLRKNGYKTVTAKHSAEQIWNEAATLLGVKTLADEARLAIKARGGSGFAKQSTQGGGLYTIESTVLLDHYSENLTWLLSQLSPNPPD
jgi:hypothetical protein